jgi:hypothetical protein
MEQEKRKKVETTEDMHGVFDNYALHYLRTSLDSIARNQHMNKLGGVQPSAAKVGDSLSSYIDHCHANVDAWEGKVSTSGDVLSEMSRQAVLLELKDEEDKAVVVDFINFVGMCCGVDFGLYTKDI